MGRLVDLNFDDVLFVELYSLLLSIEAKVVLVDRLALIEAAEEVLTVLAQVKGNVAGLVDVASALGERVSLVVVRDRPADAVERLVLVDSFEKEDLILVRYVEAVLAIPEGVVVVANKEHVENFLGHVLMLEDFVAVEI